eukprot:3136223-Rhodomonas_salina.1
MHGRLMAVERYGRGLYRTSPLALTHATVLLPLSGTSGPGKPLYGTHPTRSQAFPGPGVPYKPQLLARVFRLKGCRRCHEPSTDGGT